MYFLYDNNNNNNNNNNNQTSFQHILRKLNDVEYFTCDKLKDTFNTYICGSAYMHKLGNRSEKYGTDLWRWVLCSCKHIRRHCWRCTARLTYPLSSLWRNQLRHRSLFDAHLLKTHLMTSSSSSSSEILFISWPIFFACVSFSQLKDSHWTKYHL